MNKWRAWLVRLAGTFRKSASEAELSAELHSHLQLHIADNLRAGMLPEEARRHALMKLGGIEQTKEAYRDRRRLRWLETIWQDLRMAFRTVRLRPGFAATTVLTLALGIGATTAVFSIVDRILFRSLPYPQDERLVSFGVRAPFEGNEFMLAPEYAVLRRQPGPFESMTSLTPGAAGCDLTEADPVRLNCAVVEATFLSTFGVHPLVGRDFSVDDGRTGAARVALISYGLWRARFGGDSGVARRTISVDGKPVQIIGVLPQEFEMPNLEAVDLLLPQVLDEAALDRNHPRVLLRAFGRLRPSVTIEQAIAGLQPWFQDSLRFVPPQFRSEVSLRVRSLRERQTADSRAGAWLLFGAVTAVLLLGCTNVTNLLLVRAVGRQREVAVRAVLGASRVRLACQILTEALVLAFLGGIAGLGVAYALLRAVVIIAPEGILRLQQASLDFRVLGFCAAVTLIVAVFFGIAPALSKPAPAWLAGRATSGAARARFRHTLVAGQIAGSLILLAGAAMLLRSLWNIQNVQTGLDTRHVLTAQVSLAEHSYPDLTKQMAFFQEVETRLNRIPGIEMIALSDSLPPSGRMQATFFASIDLPGRPRPAQGTGGMVGWRMVTPGYFPALGIPIVRGRGFTEADRAPTAQPVILSQTLAARLFPTEDALGNRMRFTSFDREGGWRTVVGITGDVKNNGLTSSTDPEFYIPWKNDPGTYAGRGFVILRSSLNAASVAAWVRSEIAGIDPRVPMEFATMETRVGKLASRPRFDAFVLSFFAAVGVLLAALGIYGVVSFFVSQRTAEIGVRIALGATPRSISRLVLLSMAKWTLAGAAAGILGTWFCVRLLQSLLFEVRAHDPVLVLTAVVILLAVAIGAAWIPARRAAKVDPVVALRYE